MSMNDFELRIQGIAQLQRALFEYNKKLGGRVTTIALRHGANFMLKKIRDATPIKTGRLKKSIRLKNSRINRIANNGKIGVYIAINPGKNRSDTKGAWYGKFVEIGRRTQNGSSVPGKHMVKNTFDANKQQAAELIVSASELAVRRIAQQLNLTTRG